MITLSKIKPLLIAIIFLGVVGSVFVWTVIRISAMGEDLEVGLQAIADGQVIETQYSELQSVLEETSEERALLERFILSDEADTIAFLSELDESALALGVDFTTGTLAITDVEGPIDTLVVSFNIQGSEQAFLHMIRMFETLPYHGSISSLTFLRSSNAQTGLRDASGTITLSLSIRDYD